MAESATVDEYVASLPEVQRRIAGELPIIEGVFAAAWPCTAEALERLSADTP